MIRSARFNSGPDAALLPPSFQYDIKVVNQLSNPLPSEFADFLVVKLSRGSLGTPYFSDYPRGSKAASRLRQQESSWKHQVVGDIRTHYHGQNRMYDMHFPLASSYIVPNHSLRCPSFHISYLRQLNFPHFIRKPRETFMVWPYSHIYLISP